MLKHSWSLSTALITEEPLDFPSSSFTPRDTKMVTPAFPAAGESSEGSVWGLAACPGCCPSQVADAATDLCLHTFAFQCLRRVCLEYRFLLLFRDDQISRKEILFVLWLCPSLLLKMKIGVFTLGRWVMHLIQVNNSLDYCKKYSCFC